MSEAVRVLSPIINESDCNTGALKIEERAFLGHINLRGNPEDSAFVQTISNVLGFSLPLGANTMAFNDAVTAFWLAPDEWLLMTQPGGEFELMVALREATASSFAAVTDLSSGQTVISVSGTRALDLLAKGCTLDLEHFQVGQCAQTLMAKAGVVLYRREEAYEMVVRRSFANYLWRWLHDAAREFAA